MNQQQNAIGSLIAPRIQAYTKKGANATGKQLKIFRVIRDENKKVAKYEMNVIREEEFRVISGLAIVCNASMFRF